MSNPAYPPQQYGDQRNQPTAQYGSGHGIENPSYPLQHPGVYPPPAQGGYPPQGGFPAQPSAPPPSYESATKQPVPFVHVVDVPPPGADYDGAVISFDDKSIRRGKFGATCRLF